MVPACGESPKLSSNFWIKTADRPILHQIQSNIKCQNCKYFFRYSFPEFNRVSTRRQLRDFGLGGSCSASRICSMIAPGNHWNPGCAARSTTPGSGSRQIGIWRCNEYSNRRAEACLRRRTKGFEKCQLDRKPALHHIQSDRWGHAPTLQ